MIGGNQIIEWGTPTKKTNSVSLYPPHFAVTRLSRKNNHASIPSANPVLQIALRIKEEAVQDKICDFLMPVCISQHLGSHILDQL